MAHNESQLMQAPEEEEDFDILNEETFGDLGNGKCGLEYIFDVLFLS